MSIVKLDNTMDENKRVLQKEVKNVNDIAKYWTYYLGETVNTFATNEAKANAKLLLNQIESFAYMNFPSWIENIFIKKENKTLLEEILRDSVGVVVDEMPIHAMVMVFLDHLVDRPITKHEWEEFAKLKVVIANENKNKKENKMDEITKVNNDILTDATKNAKETISKISFDMNVDDIKKDLDKEILDTISSTKEVEEKEEVKEEEKEKISTLKKVAIGATVVAVVGAIGTAAWFLTKNK